MFLIIRKHGKKSAFRAVMMTLVFTAGFTALFHNLDYGRVPLRSLYRLMTTMRSLRYYLILLGTAVAAMIAGALVRKGK